MTTGAAENLAGHSAIEKKEEKVEKRRALGRGLRSIAAGAAGGGCSSRVRGDTMSAPPASGGGFSR